MALAVGLAMLAAKLWLVVGVAREPDESPGTPEGDVSGWGTG